MIDFPIGFLRPRLRLSVSLDRELVPAEKKPGTLLEHGWNNSMKQLRGNTKVEQYEIGDGTSCSSPPLDARLIDGWKVQKISREKKKEDRFENRDGGPQQFVTCSIMIHGHTRKR